MKQIETAIQHIRQIPPEHWPAYGRMTVEFQIQNGVVVIMEYSNANKVKIEAKKTA